MPVRLIERHDAGAAVEGALQAAPVRRITPSDEDIELRRRLEWYGPDVPFELVLQHMKDEIQALKGRRW